MLYRAFICYSHADQRWARWLHRALESYRLPKSTETLAGRVLPRRLTPIFRDRDELPSAANLSHAVNQALAQSESLIVICSPQAVASKWVNEEINVFRNLGKADHIFCLIVSGEPNAGDARECFPAALTRSDEITGIRPEPIAADARVHGDGRRDAMLKLVAGMLGIGFDALKQREQHRHQQRLIAITAGSVLISAITISLAIVATVARDDAEYRRAQAENLIDFMLGDLQEHLRESGRLDVFKTVGDEAMEYFASLRHEDVDDITLSQRAMNLRQIGEIRLEQGELAPALDAFTESLLITKRLAGRDPGNAEYQIGLGNSYFYVGLVHWQRGELRSARRYFEWVLPIVDKVVAGDAANTGWLLEQAYAYTNFGRVLEQEGALEQALSAYARVMKVNQQLIALEPGNREFELELGFAHNNLGKVLTALGRLDDAEAHFRRDLELKTRVLENKPEHNSWMSYRAVSQYFLGQLLLARGHRQEAKTQLSAALATFRRLIASDADRTRWILRRANIERALAEFYAGSGLSAESEEHLESSLQLLRHLLGIEGDNAEWRRDFVRGLLLVVDLEEMRGDRSGARSHLDLASDHIEILVRQEPDSQDVQQLAIAADLGAVRLAKKLASGSNVPLLAALQKIDRYFPDSSDPRILVLRNSALILLERVDEARRIQAKLDAMGFVGRGY